MKSVSWLKFLLSFAWLQKSLRAKFITVIVLVQLLLMTLVTFVIEKRQRETILHESKKLAFSLAANLTSLSEEYLLSYNFIKLEQTVDKIAAEEDVAYAVIQLHNGKVAAYSGHSEKQGKVLDDPVSQRALQADTRFIQEVTTMELGGKGYDVAIPFFVQGGTRKWGTIRLGFSLAQAMYEIRKTSKNLLFLGLTGIFLGSGVAIFLSRRISRPIQRLVTGVNEVAKGNYNHTIAVISHDEVGHLAQRFEEMREALRLHVNHLAEEKRRLELANKTIRDTQAQLVQSEKLAAVGMLAAKVAHEVNNPLAIIKTSLHIVNKTMQGEDPNKENLVIIEEEISRIARIVRQLLDCVRSPIELSALQVNQVLQSLMKLMAGDLAEHHVRMVLDLSPALPEIRISLDQLKQVILNLIKNALEAMPSGGTLHIQTLKGHGEVCISVTDNGAGIPAKHLSSLFEPFFSTKKDGEGMGLGLAVSASIVKNYGGRIEVESKPGEGTTFRIFLLEYPSMLVGKSLREEDDGYDRRSNGWRQATS
ncbi:MAG: ATP-binding protein [Candidatus Tectomicrobia bacterium]